MRIGAAIVTFNKPEGLALTLEALSRQVCLPECVIVVNNGEPLEVAQDDVILVNTGDNIGPAGAYALALNVAAERGIDWLFLLNDEDCPEPSAIAAVVDRVAADSDVSTLAGVIGWTITATGAYPVGARWVRGLRFPTQADAECDEYEVDVATFCGLLLRVDAALAVGGVDPTYFMMWEEFDLCLRLRQAGQRIVVIKHGSVRLPPSHDSGVAYPAWRGYYQVRNGFLMVRRLGLWSALPWHVVRSAKATFAAARLPQPGRRVALRLRGFADGVLGRVGRTVAPD